MWPKLLDLTQDECRMALRRLELESYSNVVGAFRAQGTLNADKLRILKELQEVFHISEARHKAEVRRVVNDESLSTIAKMTYGPNSEIEWNKEGSRGFFIVNRKPPQTALSAVADKACEFSETLNKNLKQPCHTERDRFLNSDNGTNVSEKLVTNDPSKDLSNVRTKTKTEKPSVISTTNVDKNRPETISAKKIDSTEATAVEPMEQPVLKTSASISVESKPSPIVENTQMNTSKQITANTLRRKSTTVLANHSTPPKAIMLSSKKNAMIEANSKLREPQSIEQSQQKQLKSNVNEIRLIPKEMPEIREDIAVSAPTYSASTQHRNKSNDKDVRVIEAVVPQKVDIIKGTQNVMNAISQGAQLVKVLDSKIIKKPVSISNMYVTKPIQPQLLKPVTVKQTFTPINASNIEYSTTNDYARLPTKPVHKIQVVSQDSATVLNNINQANSRTSSNVRSDIMSIPTARNPNIVKTSDQTIMHVSPNLHQKIQVQKRILANAQNHTKHQPWKHVIQIIPSQTQLRTVTIHPNSTIKKVPTQVQTINNVSEEYVYEGQANDWQNYDPRNFKTQNGYTKIVTNSPNNGHDYQKHASNIVSENIMYDEEIITEEYITSEEFSTDNVIEMEVDSTHYATDGVTIVSNNIIGS